MLDLTVQSQEREREHMVKMEEVRINDVRINEALAGVQDFKDTIISHVQDEVNMMTMQVRDCESGTVEAKHLVDIALKSMEDYRENAREVKIQIEQTNAQVKKVKE